MTYHIAEGPQLQVGALQLEGNDHIPAATLMALINSAPGQLLSPRNLAGDHDAILTEYYGRGLDQAAVTVTQQPSPRSRQGRCRFHIDEGEQIFVRDVLLTGPRIDPSRNRGAGHRRPCRRSAQPNALDHTQSNLYAFALFNEVNAAVVNPAGDAPRENRADCRPPRRGAGR